MRRVAYYLLTLTTLATTAATLWALSQSPFIEPLIQRSAASASLSLDRALAGRVTSDWVTERLVSALDLENGDEIELLIELAQDQHVEIGDDLLARATDFVEAEGSLANRVSDCATCAADIGSCGRISDIAACAVPFEMSPLGDANALRRASMDWAAGREVDRIDAGLAAAGLGATGLAIGTAGTSLTVKAGVSLMRAARRMGAVTPAFTRSLRQYSNLHVDWRRLPDYLQGRVPLDTVTDTTKLAAIGALAGDLGAIRRNTSTADALVLMRHIDDPADAARMARLSSLEGPRTRHAIYALGKSRAFRAMLRLSDLALATLGLMAALLMQIPALLAEMVRRALRPPSRRVA